MTDDTRPRNSSGVSTCTSVLRTTTLTLSVAPQRNIIVMDSQNECDSPNTAVATPKPATASSSVIPSTVGKSRFWIACSSNEPTPLSANTFSTITVEPIR